MSRKYLWAIAHSYDWEQGFRLYYTEQAMLNAIRKDFKIEEEIPDPSRDQEDSTEFWDACLQAYEQSRRWKSYQAVKIDAETGMHESIW